jgi:ABC-type hemin transport system substrate-binding protein
MRTAALIFIVIQSIYGTLSAETVEDQLGRSLELPMSPQRIVALAPSVTEIIFALHQEERLMGVTRYSNYPVKASELSRVGSYIRLDLEKIVALNPDLCIAIKDGNPKELVNRLQSMKIPVYVVLGPDHRLLVPACLFGGGAYLVFCDLLSRTIPQQGEMPAGVITALIGAPVFIFLLKRSNR